MSKWKQFWCKHVWKDVSDEIELRTQREYDGDELPGMGSRFSTYTYYGIRQKCLNCNKERYYEKRKIYL